MQACQRFDGLLRGTHHRGAMQAQFAKLFINEKNGRQVTLEEMSQFLCREAKDFIQGCRGGGPAGNTAQCIRAHRSLAHPFHNE